MAHRAPNRHRGVFSRITHQNAAQNAADAKVAEQKLAPLAKAFGGSICPDCEKYIEPPFSSEHAPGCSQSAAKAGAR